jgi:hypothetical protein
VSPRPEASRPGATPSGIAGSNTSCLLRSALIDFHCGRTVFAGTERIVLKDDRRGGNRLWRFPLPEGSEGRTNPEQVLMKDWPEWTTILPR